MTRLLVAIVFAMAAFGQDVTVEQAGNSPLDFARYLGSHSNIDWKPLWSALGNSGDPPEYAPRCSPARGCSTELITVLKPSQVIVILQGDTGRDFYFRFLEQNGGWQLSGCYTALIANRRRGVFRIGDKPFLKVAERGVIASGYNLELEHWFDLTHANLDPAFTFATFGGEELLDLGISRQITEDALPQIVNGVETIDLTLRVQFSFEQANLGSMVFQAVYQRPPGQGTFTIRSANAPGGPISTSAFEHLANVLDGPDKEDMLVYALPGLKRIASGKDEETKKFLKGMLEKCKDTPEKRALLELLAKP